MQLSHMIPGVNIIGRKVSVASVNGTKRTGGILRKFLRSEEHLNWLKINLNATEIIAIQDYAYVQN